MAQEPPEYGVARRQAADALGRCTVVAADFDGKVVDAPFGLPGHRTAQRSQSLPSLKSLYTDSSQVDDDLPCVRGEGDKLCFDVGYKLLIYNAFHRLYAKLRIVGGMAGPMSAAKDRPGLFMAVHGAYELAPPDSAANRQICLMTCSWRFANALPRKVSSSYASCIPSCVSELRLMAATRLVRPSRPAKASLSAMKKNARKAEPAAGAAGSFRTGTT